MRLLAAVLLLCAGSAQAEPWTDVQKGLAATYLVAHAIDWGQTRHIARAPNKFREYNPILGADPSLGKVNAYFVLTPILWCYFLDAIPQYRTPVLAVLNVVELGIVAHNFHVGLKVSF
jgi:hypothetical protein